MPQQEQASQPQRKGPPPGWRYPDRAKHRSRLSGWLAAIWRGTRDNAALVSLVGVLLTLLVTTMLTQLEGVRQQNLAQEELINQRTLEAERAEAAASVAEQQAQQESLQTYLGDMGELILQDNSPLPEASSGEAVSTLAQAKTLTVLGGLDPQSKGIVLQFLGNTQLIQSVEEKEPIIKLVAADLKGVKLSNADLKGADLLNADLRDAVLSNAFMSEADLLFANLRGANLRGADLSGALLTNADLTDADLTDADLHGAALINANLRDANLSGADLSGAILNDARDITKDRLEQQAASLEGASMPDGSIHP